MAHYDFDVAVIGGGAAGLTASGLAASLGARTVLIERDRLGGECTWSGCVPSKALIRAAAVAQSMRTADRYGITPAEPEIDFRKVMDAMRHTRQEIYEEADAPERVTARQVEVIESTAFFVDPHTLELGGSGRQIRARYFIICAGSSPVVPKIAGGMGAIAVDPITGMLTGATCWRADGSPAGLSGGGARMVDETPWK